jgi:uncharacterized membrane protein YccC
MPLFGAAVGTVIGILVAGVLYKLLPDHELTTLLAGIVAAGCIIGAALEWHHDFGRKK